ncbi:MAG: DUF2156 domain-containing protein [Oscillospiraceae bacterium]|nr:DUF2156 domain-containing protein [Oscillospiraceae bacterium]
MEEYFSQSNLRSCEFCFSSTFNWRNVYGAAIAEKDGCLVIRCSKPVMTYSYPVGLGNLKSAVDAIIADAQKNGTAPIINCIPKEGVEKLEALYPNKFDFVFSRDTCDYIYTTESLATLKGKKLHAKRNHINNFKKANPDWVYENITPENLKDCWEMNVKWNELNAASDDTGLSSERRAVENAFNFFEEEGLRGGLLRLSKDSPVIAYTMGRPLNSDTFIVHIEKAFHDIQGAYPMINQQFVLNNCMDFAYINREDDAGAENLRKAKLSYYPEILLEKYHAVPKEKP